MAWQEPKTDWVANPKSPMSEDFNRIESNIDFLKGDIETKKGAIVNALNTVGLASSLEDTHATLASRITGSNQGTKIITPSTVNQTIAKGFHSGQGYVKGDANLIGANIRSGKSIFGVAGTFDKVYTQLETDILTTLKLPSFPIGVTIAGRYRIAENGSYPPSGKVWFTANNGFDVQVATQSGGVSSYGGKNISGTHKVLEIDLPGAYWGGSSAKTITLPSNKKLMGIFLRDYSTSYTPYAYLYDAAGNRRYFVSSSLAYGVMLAPRYPFIIYHGIKTEDIYCFVVDVSSWPITYKEYTLSSDQLVTVGTVPSGEQWLLTISTSQTRPEGIYIDGRRKGNVRSCIVKPGEKVTVKGSYGYTTSAYIATLRLQV